MKHKYMIIIFICFILILSVFITFKWPYLFPNNILVSSNSSYLVQHKNDYVNWNVWGEDILLKAERENKLLFISIGFATCYWCHYMQKDSFQNFFLAQFINQNFIPILIDKEQLPNINQIYMNFTVNKNGFGGWPLTIIATSNGFPLFSNTTMERKELKESLSTILDQWDEDSAHFSQHSFDLQKAYISDVEMIVNYSSQQSITNNIVELKRWLSLNIDPLMHGLKGTQKFPNSYRWSQIIDIDSSQLTNIQLMVNTIITSPLYDIVDGGIHRYSSDKTWSVPHFEKLLIDQVNFMKLLLKLHLKTSNSLYLNVVKDVLDFTHNFLKNEEGLFITGLDAGNVGSQGHYYFIEEQFVNLNNSNLDFIRLTDQEGLISLRSVNDFVRVDRSYLKKYRQDNKKDLNKDSFVSIKYNTKLMEVIFQYNQLSGDDSYSESVERIKEFIIKHSTISLTLEDLLVVYDSFKMIGYEDNLSDLNHNITNQLTSDFPYYKSIEKTYLPHALVFDFYKDNYDYPQKLYYLLKYSFPNVGENQLSIFCEELTKILYDPWEQISLVKFFHNNCN